MTTNNQNAAASHNQQHTRVNNTRLARLEKKALLWMAARMPAWVTPDKLTVLGLLASFLIFASYALTMLDHRFLWLASLGFVIQWFGDSMDGTLARYRKIERPRYGFFVDHIIDSVSEVLVFVGLGISPFLNFELALISLIAYLLASIYVYLATYVNGVFRISYGGLSPTEMRLIAVVTNTVVFFAGNPTVLLPNLGLAAAPVMITLFDLVVIILTIIIIGLFIASAITTALELSEADRIASRERKLQERARRAAHRQTLRDERRLRKTAAKAARQARLRVNIE